MQNNSVPSSPCSITNSRNNISLKISRGKNQEEKRGSLTASQKVIDSSEEFEKGRTECMKMIEENKAKLEKEVNRNKELRAELESLLKVGYASPKSAVKFEDDDNSLVDYYKNKLEEIEKVAENQKKEFMEMIKKQEAENNVMKQMIAQNEKRVA